MNSNKSVLIFTVMWKRVVVWNSKSIFLLGFIFALIINLKMFDVQQI